MSLATLQSMSSHKSESKELCIICEAQPYDLVCTCGDKFDFSCIHQHVEQLGIEFQDHHQLVSEQMIRINGLQEANNFDAARALINNWKRKRIQDINDIADTANNRIQEQQDSFASISPLKADFDKISEQTQRIVHENLNAIITLHRQIKDKIEELSNLPELIHDDISLDSEVQSKLNPLALNTNSSSSSNIPLSSSSSNIHLSSSSSNINNHETTTIEIEPTPTLPLTPITSNSNASTHEEPPIELTNSTNENDTTSTTTNGGTNHDEFEAGHTRHIQRNNPILIPTNNDKFAGTVCCHDNQLLYNDYDRTTRSSRLTFIPDLTRPGTKQTIDWNPPDTTVVGGNDDDWIQDIVYSNILPAYLILTRSRLRIFNDHTTELEEFHTFENRTMKRLACNRRYIYLTSAHSSVTHNGDEIILLNYDKEEQLCKTFRDIIPSRINRGAGPLVGDISDIAVGMNEQVTIGYRLERRHEVGVCLFNVTNEGREWSCIKQLLLNECWHDDLSYTPRVDWCERLNVFILIEHMTGHLIMIDRDGQVDGECRFMHVENRRESPINLSISTNDWICVRYETSISIHKIIGSPRS